jgi:phosphoribosylaminoimidazole-succinocarboxamide synthase
MMQQSKGAEIARGKTKVLYECAGEPERLIVEQMDAITAGDGARRDVISGKGRLAALTTSRVFRFLNRRGLPTHYLGGGEDVDHNAMLVRRCAMIPLEVVVRRVVAGSYARRHPGVPRGTRLEPHVVEFFLKDDEHHDPMIAVDEIVARGIASLQEVERIGALARATFDALEEAWQDRNVTLVDLKVEFGRLTGGERNGQLVLADVVDNDSWRIWPQGREETMLDKQIYRNLEQSDAEGLARVKRAYEEVAEAVAGFDSR